MQSMLTVGAMLPRMRAVNLRRDRITDCLTKLSSGSSLHEKAANCRSYRGRSRLSSQQNCHPKLDLSRRLRRSTFSHTGRFEVCGFCRRSACVSASSRSSPGRKNTGPPRDGGEPMSFLELPPGRTATSERIAIKQKHLTAHVRKSKSQQRHCLDCSCKSCKRDRSTTNQLRRDFLNRLREACDESAIPYDELCNECEVRKCSNR